MRIQSIHLQNFKRFTDLKIDAIPNPAKLVLLIGANGSGKSSVFDALNCFGTQTGSNDSRRTYATFFPVFPQKRMPLDFLAQFNLTKARLAKALWFKAQIRVTTDP
jgi:predicted ATP-dependent endonuclease of OLD family